MKRTFATTAAMAALLVGAVPASAATSASDNQAATADVPATLEATIPTSTVGFGNIAVGSAGAESGVQTISVSSNQAWGATLSADRTNMAEYNTATPGYVESGATLGNAFQWKRTTQSGTSYASVSTAPAAGNLLSGQAATGGTPASVGAQFKQVTSFGDTVLGADRDYRIQVTYNVAQGI